MKVNSELAKKFVGQADCDCVDATKEGIPCPHDLALAEEKTREESLEVEREHRKSYFSNLGEGDL